MIKQILNGAKKEGRHLLTEIESKELLKRGRLKMIVDVL
jgi:hypothetical protein